MAQFTTVASFRDLPLAELARARLESEGIECFLSDANLIGIQWLYSFALGGVKVKVREEDAKRAKEILQVDMVPETPVEHEDLCERCHSANISVVQTSPLASVSLIVFSFFLLGIPLLFIRKRYKCTDCGHIM